MVAGVGLGANYPRLPDGIYHYTTAPKSLPTPAVSPIASAPQKATRIAPLAIDAPPAYAAIPPRITKATSAVADETSATRAEGANNAAAIGIIAPATKEIAEANAA